MIIIKGGQVVSESGIKKQDVLIDGEKVAKVAEHIEADGAQVIDATGKLLFPGFIDAHTHFELHVCGTVTADDFPAGTKAAISGGTTTIVDFATQYRGETLHDGIAEWHRRSDDKSSCDYGFHLAISEWNESLSKELKQIVDEGVSSFKLYLTYDDNMVDDKELYEILTRMKELGVTAGVHCENDGIIKARTEIVKADGHMGVDMHPVTRPDEAEAEAIARLLRVAQLVDTPIIIVHLSTRAGYEEVMRARQRGQKVYVETCPQYLLLDESRYKIEPSEARKYVCAPPLRTKESQDTLWKAIMNKEVDTINTDHCSFTTKQKDAGKDDFKAIPGGMPGVETRPELMYSFGVKTGKITEADMCRLLSSNEARLYGMYPRKGVIAEGSDADIVIWDPDKKHVISAKTQVSVCDYSPFEGVEVTGIAHQVYLRGQLIAEDGKVLKENCGTYIERQLPEFF